VFAHRSFFILFSIFRFVYFFLFVALAGSVALAQPVDPSADQSLNQELPGEKDSSSPSEESGSEVAAPVKPIEPSSVNEIPESTTRDPEAFISDDPHKPSDLSDESSLIDRSDSLSTPDFGVSSADRIIYFFERVKIRGNTSTSPDVIKNFIPFNTGDPFNVDDPSIEHIRWRLMGTGWFNDVKLSLERGSKRGWIVLVVDVEERNTLIVTRVVLGLSADVKKSMEEENTEDYDLQPYAGIGVAETNLFGLGIGAALSGVYSKSQKGIDLLYSDPTRLGGGFNLDGHFFYNYGREFFGRDDESTEIDVSCIDPDTGEQIPGCDEEVRARTAVIRYDRFSLGLGTGHDISSTLRYAIGWQGELVNVISKPTAAIIMRGGEIVPIDFHIENDDSIVSSLYFSLIFDRRNDPPFPTRGQLIRLDARIGAAWLGSSYDFARYETVFRHWQPLPWHHVLSFGVYLGAIYDDAPFFYRFYVSDLSDLIPSRILELNLDHRGAPNFLGTSIEAMRREELAGKIDIEYNLPLHRGGGGFRGVDAYGRIGLYSLASWEDLRYAIRGYEGVARIPLDLTFDLGLRADTSVGVFTFGFSTLVGFIPDPW
jgi:outer membrane protein insertion porin family